MPVIKPRTRGKQFVRHTTRLDRENHETLYAYATFLGEETDYLLNQLIDSVLGKDREFVTWRSQHPESCVPGPSARSVKRKRRHAGQHQAGSSGQPTSLPVAG
jgi:hypothetical protein